MRIPSIGISIGSTVPFWGTPYRQRRFYISRSRGDAETTYLWCVKAGFVFVKVEW